MDMYRAAAQAAPLQLQGLTRQYTAVAHPQSGQSPQLLGSGGYGCVFKYSFQNSAGQQEIVAIKRMQLSGLPKAAAQGLEHTLPRELCIHYRLHHPHIARIRDAFLSRDLGHKVLNIVMEFVQGGTLIDYVNTHRPVSETTARWLFQQLVVTLDYLHAQDPPVSHRDIKLENALAEPVHGLPLPQMKVVDFGLSRTGTLAGTLNVGTLDYMAPELYPKGPENPLNPAAGDNSNSIQYVPPPVDVWSAGVLLYAVLNMAYPWPKEWPAGQRWKAMHLRPLEYSAGAAARLTNDCKDLLEQMLHPDPAQRITIEGIKDHPWFKVDLDPGLLALKAQCMDLPSPCELTPAQLSTLVAEVQQALKQGLQADAVPAAPAQEQQAGMQLQQLLAAVFARYAH